MVPWKIKNSKFSADIQQIEKKMQTNCILIATNFASRSSYWLQIIFFQFTVVLLIYFHNQFVAPEICHSRLHCSVCQQSTWYSLQQQGQDFDKKNFTRNQYEERLAILNTENIKLCGWTAKLEAIKMQYVCISAMCVEYLQKIWIFNFPR